MDVNKYLELLSRVSPYLYEDFSLEYKVPKKDLSFQEINVTFAIVPITTSKGILLIEEEPLHFFLSLGIFVGKQTPLFSFQFKTNNETLYIAQESIVNKLKPKINQESLSRFSPRDLSKISYSKPFKLPEVIAHLKEFTKLTTNRDLNLIHLSQGSGCKLFLPNVHKEDLELAKDLDIALTSLIQDNYIKDTNIHILDDKSLLEQLKSVFTEQKKEVVAYVSSTHQKATKDLVSTIFFKPKPEELKNLLFKIPSTNLNNKNINHFLSSLKAIKLNGTSSIPLILWKLNSLSALKTFKNKDEFKEFSGVDFSFSQKDLKEIYLTGGIKGTKLKFLEYTLKTQFIELFMHNNEKEITLQDIKQIPLTLYLFPKLEKLYLEEELSNEIQEELFTISHKLISNVLSSSVSTLSLPKLQKPSNLYEEYFVYTSKDLEKLNKEFKQNSSKKGLLEKIHTSLRNTYLIVKNFKDYSQNTYFLVLYLEELFSILKIFNNKKTGELENSLHELIGPVSKQETPKNFSKQEEELLIQLSSAKELAKKEQISIYIHNSFDPNFIPNSFELIKTVPQESLKIVPNYDKLKSLFPYSYKEIGTKLSSLKSELIPNEITIKNKKIKIQETFYLLIPFFKHKKNIFTNSYCSFYVEL